MPSGDHPEPSGRLTPIEFDRDKLMIRIEVTLNADPTAISPVVEGIMEMARRMDCASGKEFEIETALREALANAILHGCKNDSTKKVQCCVSCDEEHGLLIIVRDPGTAGARGAPPAPGLICTELSAKLKARTGAVSVNATGDPMTNVEARLKP